MGKPRPDTAQTTIIIFFFFYYHFYFLPAQLVGGFTLSDLLEKKPWSEDLGVVPFPPRYVPSIFMAHRV